MSSSPTPIAIKINPALPRSLTSISNQPILPAPNPSLFGYPNPSSSSSSSSSPSFKFHPLPSSLLPDHVPPPDHGAAASSTPRPILLIIPTSNASKTKLLTSHLTARLQSGAGGELSVLTIPASSEAGEQPYDDQGILGAYNRINNALLQLPDHLPPAGDGSAAVTPAPTVIVGAVENFISRSGPAPAVDYGAVVLYNATSGQVKVGISRGVQVPTEYWREAETYGFEDGAQESEEEGKKGKVTVGEVLAAHFEGDQLDKADWHKVLSAGNVSRYELLSDALEEVGVPW
ncbi:hypothetical protein QBC42DRAFT_266822 [Cladorrhinum samala]|uniref:Non-canonical purine NTP phosphatase/PRRC1 domain-containing protein n=1 Tax=Cladorrhinum samala TaxID=585594 RepID=A0AAV9HSE1_9PEZI|nr:hypothetical protein QBC42DRAFT_266822 [Cladorrhinum samala]